MTSLSASWIFVTGLSLAGSLQLPAHTPLVSGWEGCAERAQEKALGNIAKTGTVPIVDALEPAERPTRAGLNFMDTSCAAAETVTLMAAAGAVIHVFPTGQGNVIGNPIIPVIKLTGNPVTASTMGEHIDLDVSSVLDGALRLRDAGSRLEDLVYQTANGRLTCAEVLGHREFVLTKLYRSA